MEFCILYITFPSPSPSQSSASLSFLLLIPSISVPFLPNWSSYQECQCFEVSYCFLSKCIVVLLLSCSTLCSFISRFRSDEVSMTQFPKSFISSQVSGLRPVIRGTAMRRGFARSSDRSGSVQFGMGRTWQSRKMIAW